MKETPEKKEMKDRIRKWMGVSGVFRERDVLDMAILETFFYVYNGLEEGRDIHELGNDLGVFPVP
jgi:hypothetical protein